MSYASKITKGEKVDLSNGYSAQVRVLLSDEEDAVQALYLGSRKTKANQKAVDKVVTTNVDVEVDPSAKIRETLIHGIVSWDLDGDPGDDMDDAGVLKINAKNIGKLSGGDRGKLFNKINELTNPPDEDEKKD